jgi:hypothetical protein
LIAHQIAGLVSQILRNTEDAFSDPLIAPQSQAAVRYA